jgi:hypothetical protein
MLELKAINLLKSISSYAICGAECVLKAAPVDWRYMSPRCRQQMTAVLRLGQAHVVANLENIT